MLMFMGAPAMAATALAGTPLAGKAMPSPCRSRCRCCGDEALLHAGIAGEPVAASSSMLGEIPTSSPRPRWASPPRRGYRSPCQSACCSVEYSTDHQSQRMPPQPQRPHAASSSSSTPCSCLMFSTPKLQSRRPWPARCENRRFIFGRMRCILDQLASLNQAIAAERQIVVIPSAYDALGAADRAGFDSMFVGRVPIAARSAFPDIGLKASSTTSQQQCQTSPRPATCRSWSTSTTAMATLKTPMPRQLPTSAWARARCFSRTKPGPSPPVASPHEADCRESSSKLQLKATMAERLDPRDADLRAHDARRRARLRRGAAPRRRHRAQPEAISSKRGSVAELRALRASFDVPQFANPLVGQASRSSTRRSSSSSASTRSASASKPSCTGTRR